MRRIIIIVSQTLQHPHLTLRHWLIIAMIALFGFVLRTYPGEDNIIWSYDQARDSVVIRSIISEKNIIITGPQTEFFGLSHGPLYYYLAAPFYHLAQANPNIVLYFMIVLNLSAIVPVVLLTQSLFKSTKLSLLVALLFAVSYQQIEYARWLSNVSVAIPMLAWSYYFLWKTVAEDKRALLTGLFTGLAMQAEFFLIFMLSIAYLFFYFSKVSWKSVLKYHLGFLLGASSFIVAELKFNFLGSKTFVTEFLMGHSDKITAASYSLNKFIDHLGFTTQQTVFGITPAMGLLVLLLGWIVVFYYRNEAFVQNSKKQLLFIATLMFAHSILLTFHFIDAVFLNLTFLVPVLVFTAYIIGMLYAKGHRVAAYLLVLGIVVSQLMQLQSNTVERTPFQLYNFHQTGILFSQKQEIVEAIYEAADGKEFTFGVLGTPYGVQTVWATLFENYLWQHPDAYKPQWYGFRALGFPADSYFEKVDHPGEVHILLVEDNSKGVLSEYVYDDYMKIVDEATDVISEKQLYGFTVEIRAPSTFEDDAINVVSE